MSLRDATLAASAVRREPQIPHAGQRPRVLHVIEATLGGTLVYLDTVITATEGLPFQFGLAYSTGRATPALKLALEKAERFGWQLFPLEMDRDVRIRQDVLSCWNLTRIYRSFRPDVVHSHSSKAGALSRIARLGAGWRSPRVMYTPNAVAAPLGKRYLWMERSLVPLTTRMVPVSDSEAKELLGMRLTFPGRYKTVDPMIDTAYFTPRDKTGSRVALGLSSTAPLVVAVGRLTAQKGPMAFLRTLKCLLATMPEAQGIWVGDGEMRAEFLAYARELGIESHVTVAGWKNDVRPWLAASDVLLSTSEYESFGYMVAECLAMERPVVATNITGTCDILRGDFSAWLYEKGDAERAAALLASLLRAPARSAEVGALGREMVIQRFSAEVMRQALFSLYAEFC